MACVEIGDNIGGGGGGGFGYGNRYGYGNGRSSNEDVAVAAVAVGHFCIVDAPTGGVGVGRRRSGGGEIDGKIQRDENLRGIAGGEGGGGLFLI